MLSPAEAEAAAAAAAAAAAEKAAAAAAELADKQPRKEVLRVGDAAEGLRATREGGVRFDVLIEPWRVGGMQE